MRKVFFFVSFILLSATANAEPKYIGKDEAHSLVVTMMSRLASLQDKAIGLRSPDEPETHRKSVQNILKQIVEIQEPVRRAFERDLELGASKLANNEKASELAKVWKCYQATTALGKFAYIALVETRPLHRSSLTAKLYLDFLRKREDCEYQLGKVPPSHLKTPTDVYRMYLKMMETSLREMMAIDDPDFLTEATSNEQNWMHLHDELIWHLYTEQHWELYKLYTINSLSSIHREKYKEDKYKLWPCQSMHGTYNQLTEQFALSLTVGYRPLLDARKTNRLVKKFAECDTALTSQSGN
ncbi:hypothetical protein FIV00_27575 [Labrenzia sp. THAF82]|uniref:hypothetical protein n=1 Tax=Labrenzia sp. THAF82 TaxID=2587861 RepID=UPI00126948D8|nr:hypothetical protein [Labrenzia sp. THAF82]QFT34288.1 hypothetical protein FIV00_27575 [Labrenzia sp. THAF82]